MIQAAAEAHSLENDFVHAFKAMQHAAYAVNAANGWHAKKREDGTFIALMHSELSEALEAARKGNPTDKHCPLFGNLEVELADVIIRIMDYAEAKGLPVAEAIIAKLEANAQRGYRHGGKEF